MTAQRLIIETFTQPVGSLEQTAMAARMLATRLTTRREQLVSRDSPPSDITIDHQVAKTTDGSALVAYLSYFVPAEQAAKQDGESDAR